MLKLSLYHFFRTFMRIIKTYSYRKDQNYTPDRGRTSAIRGWLSQWQEPFIPYALPCNTPEIKRIKVKRSRGTYRNDPYICEFMDQTVRDRRNFRSGYPSGSRSQADHGLFGRGSCPQSHRAGQAKREEIIVLIKTNDITSRRVRFLSDWLKLFLNSEIPHDFQSCRSKTFFTAYCSPFALCEVDEQVLFAQCFSQRITQTGICHLLIRKNIIRQL